MPGAAVHRHILYRMNAINDSLKKQKKKIPSKGRNMRALVTLAWFA